MPVRGGKGGGPTPFTNAFDHSQINSLRYNTSQAGSVVPVVFGTQRIGVNVIEGWGFMSTGTSGKGGKGGMTSKNKKNGPQYSVFVAFALCNGPVAFTGSTLGFGGNNRIWANGGMVFGLGTAGLNGFAGNDGQAQDPNFDASGNPNVPHLGYSGTCYVTGDPLHLGSSPALPFISFEITGFRVGTCGATFPNDANPGLIISDIITDNRWGLNLPLSYLDSTSLTDFENYCQAGTLAVSMVLDKQQPSSRWIEEIGILTSTAICNTSFSIKFFPYFQQTLTDGVITWNPSLTPVYAIGDDDVLPWSAQPSGSVGVDESSPETDPIVVTRADPAEATNWLSMEYMNAQNAFNPDMIQVVFQGNIDVPGLVDEPSIQGHQFTNPQSATAAAYILLSRKQGSRNTYKWQTGWRFCLLEIGDVVSLSDSGQGLVSQLVRIMAMEEGSEGELIFEAEQVGGNSGALPLIGTQSPTGTLIADPNAAPGNVNTPIVFEPPVVLSNNDLEVWIVATGGAQWGGCQVFISLDNATYDYAGTIYTGGRQGLLTAPFASHADPDTVDTLSVDLTESRGTLASTTAAECDAFVTLCYVDGELISYQGATLTSTYHYNIATRIRRGVYGSTIGAHATSSQFARIGPNDPSVFKYVYPSQYVGSTIYIKLASFNFFGNQLQDISLLTPVTYVLTGAGTSKQQYQVTGNLGGLPGAAAIIFSWVASVATVFDANLVGSQFIAGIASTGIKAFTIKKNGVTFDTATFAAAGTVATFAGGAATFSAGDTLTIVAPTPQDATLANLSWNFVGHS